MFKLNKLLPLLIISSCTLSFLNVHATENWNFLNYNTKNDIPKYIVDGEINLKRQKKIDISLFYDKTQLIANIVAEDNLAYTLDRNNKIVIIDTISNKIVKKIPLPKYKLQRPTGLAIFKGYLYIGFDDGSLVAFSIFSESILWTTKVLTPINSVPIVDENKVFIVSNNTIYAFDIQNGATLWTYSGSKAGVSLKILYGVSVASGYVMVGLSSSDVLILRKENGNLVWRYNIQGTSSIFNVNTNPILGDIKAPIIISKENVLLASNNKLVYLSLSKQQVNWQINNFGSNFPSIKYGEDFITVTTNNTLLRLNSVDGQIKWQQSILSSKKYSGKVIWYNPIIINNYIMLSNNIGEVIFYNAQKGTLYKYFKIYDSTIEQIYNPPIILNNKVFFLSSKGCVYIYSLTAS